MARAAWLAALRHVYLRWLSAAGGCVGGDGYKRGAALCCRLAGGVMGFFAAGGSGCVGCDPVPGVCCGRGATATGYSGAASSSTECRAAKWRVI